jgi:hypothetical protein
VAGQEALPWQTELVDADRTAHYHLTLQPLWYVEGGICAMEIMVSDLSHPDRNLLGKPVVSALQPFVITVEELEAGIENSRFGTVRKFRLPNATKQTLTVRILASKVGDRGGGVPGVPRIESLTLAFAVTSH